MKKHLRYANYVLRHKWYVFLECCRLGIPWRGITHDLSKFRPSEWRPYAEFFYGTKQHGEYWEAHAATGGIVELAPWGMFVKDHFNLSWLKHQHRNPHHWQFWCLREDSGNMCPIPMPDRYRKEMLADWRGAGRAINGEDNTLDWFLKNGLKMLLHSETRTWIEENIPVGKSYTLAQFLAIGQYDYDRSATSEVAKVNA